MILMKIMNIDINDRLYKYIYDRQNGKIYFYNISPIFKKPYFSFVKTIFKNNKFITDIDTINPNINLSKPLSTKDVELLDNEIINLLENIHKNYHEQEVKIYLEIQQKKVPYNKQESYYQDLNNSEIGINYNIDNIILRGANKYVLGFTTYRTETQINILEYVINNAQ